MPPGVGRYWREGPTGQLRERLNGRGFPDAIGGPSDPAGADFFHGRKTLFHVIIRYHSSSDRTCAHEHDRAGSKLPLEQDLHFQFAWQ
jgi:hypothetical protein